MKRYYVGNLTDRERLELDMLHDPGALGIHDDEYDEDDLDYEESERRYQAKIEAEELAEARRIESEENERTER